MSPAGAGAGMWARSPLTPARNSGTAALAPSADSSAVSAAVREDAASGATSLRALRPRDFLRPLSSLVWAGSPSSSRGSSQGRSTSKSEVPSAEDSTGMPGSSAAAVASAPAAFPRRRRTLVLRSPMKVVSPSPVSSKSEAWGTSTLRRPPLGTRSRVASPAWAASSRSWALASARARWSSPARARRELILETASEMEKPQMTMPVTTRPTSTTLPTMTPRKRRSARAMNPPT